MATTNEVDNDFELVGTLQNEQVTALLVVVLNAKFPNVQFEAVETGYGAYNVKVRSRYTLGPILPETMHVFKEEMFSVYDVVGIAVRHLEKEGLLK